MPDIEYNLAGEAAAGNQFFLNPDDSRDYGNQPSIPEKLLKPEEQVLVDRRLQLMKKKGAYPYDWMSDWAMLNSIDTSIGHIFKVDWEYPAELHDWLLQ